MLVAEAAAGIGVILVDEDNRENDTI